MANHKFVVDDKFRYIGNLMQVTAVFEEGHTAPPPAPSSGYYAKYRDVETGELSKSEPLFDFEDEPQMYKA